MQTSFIERIKCWRDSVII